jgi:cellulose biosynthesis protein BcsQ
VPTGELTDYLVKGLVGLASTVLGSFAIWAFHRYRRLRRVEEAYQDLRDEKAELAADLDQAEAARAAWEGRYERLRATDQEVRDKFVVLRAAYLALKERAAGTAPAPAPARDAVDVLTRDRDQARQQAADLRVEVDQLRQKAEDAEARLADLTRFDGRLWLREPAGAFPGFRPRAERKAVIISVLNLKGGVGKTTLTANLAATLARPDAPALVIDLDYQRSLSMLLVADKRRKELHGNRWTVQHFLRGPDHRLADLAGRLEGLAPDLPHCSVLTNSDVPAGGDAADSLEETENRLLVEWLFDRTRPDPRFFLREALHDPGLEVGYVLLDCPPRLTTACVNALAASDFVLVPTVPDSVSTHAVENLLYTLREFKHGLLPELAVLGVVPNMLRLRLGDPIEAHAAALRELRDALSGVWPEPVPIFQAGIKHDSAFGVSAAELDTNGKLRLAVSDGTIRESFQALAHELEKEVRRHASRRAATVPAKPGARARSR